jgi:hypothetical protein
MDQSTDAGMVGPFWVVEADRQATIIALALPLKGADCLWRHADRGHRPP